MRKILGAVCGLALTAGAVLAADAPSNVPDISTLNPAALKALIPAKIDWKSSGPKGPETAVLVGDPTKPGLYVIINRFHPGNFSQPHYHPNNRYIMVVSGTWWVATGTTFDPEHNTVPMKAGTFVTHVGREVHYDGARSTATEPAVVMILGEGPGTRNDCSAEPGPGPCETARAAAKR